MPATNRRNAAFATLSIVAVLALATAAAVIPTGPTSASANVAPMVGIATGELQDGIPVYRLPPVAVTASRSAELAKIAREERLASK
jgi:hypothetical protein